MTARHLVFALLSLLSLLGVCVRAPALEVVRRTAGSLEAVAPRRHERPTALEKPSELARIRVTRAARSAEAEAAGDPSLYATPWAASAFKIAESSSIAALAPHPASWIEPAKAHAELMVFLN